MQASDSRTNDQVTLLQSYKQEISKLKSIIKSGEEESKLSLKELETLKLRFSELQRKERILHVDLEQSKCRVSIICIKTTPI